MGSWRKLKAQPGAWCRCKVVRLFKMKLGVGEALVPVQSIYSGAGAKYFFRCRCDLGAGACKKSARTKPLSSTERKRSKISWRLYVKITK